ncbi:MAG: DUF3332 family protein [Candidatus Sumerlaeia bacterium]|nr:DUF3332 family protein [Candidatus Sumerlaeia bacterium]
MSATSSTPSRRLFRGSYVRFTSLVLAGGVLMGALVGCYGRFPLTNAIYKWNGEVTQNGFVNSIIMVILGFFLPVYGLAIWIDALILNSIEYWKGEEINVAKTYQQPDGTTVVLAPGSHKDEATLTVFSANGDVLEQRTFLRQGDGTTQVLDADSKIVAVVHPTEEGGFTFTDQAGLELGELTSTQIAQVAARVN